MSENKVDPKEIEKVQKLLSDKEFVKKLISQETVEDAKKLFENQGIATSIEEMEMLGRFIKKISQKSNEKLSEKDLEEISGGSAGSFVVRSLDAGVGALGYGFAGEVSGMLLSEIANTKYSQNNDYNNDKNIVYGALAGAAAGIIYGAKKALKQQKDGTVNLSNIVESDI